VVPDVFLVLFKVDGRDGLAGSICDVGDVEGSHPVHIGALGGAGGNVDAAAGLVLMNVGGDFRGDFDLDRNMLSVVAARVMDRVWKGSVIGKDLGDRASGTGVLGEAGEKAEGDIDGLALLDIGAH
jgi:hypothetical protein